MSYYNIGCVSFICLIVLINTVTSYEVPTAIIEVLQPKGFKASIPDEEGMTRYAFHGRINEEFEQTDAGQFAADVLKPSSKNDGFWTYTNRHVNLKIGDVIHYWIQVEKDGVSYSRVSLSYEVKDNKTCDRTAEFHCRNDKCIPKIKLCDFDDDCGDNSDEPTYMCGRRNCTNGLLRCPGLNNYRCIPELLFCNGKNDCKDNSDELAENCTTVNQKRPHNNTGIEISAIENSSHPSTNDQNLDYEHNKEVVDIRSQDSKKCLKSITTVNGMSACSGYLIFETDFSFGIGENWTNEVRFNSDESEFVVFDNNTSNFFSKFGFLNLKPALLDEYYGEGFTLNGTLDLGARCTSREQVCDRTRTGFSILPPVMSARLTTDSSFSFKYGVLEMKAKLPRGDWVIPELWLQPKRHSYGYRNSGKIVLTKSIGNPSLTFNGKDIGNNLLTCGLQVKDKTQTFDKSKEGGLWSDDFHIFKLQWTDKKISFFVDNEELGEWDGKYNPLLEGHDSLSPFDQEFYLLLGVHVGGYLDIPDGALSNGRPKPWRNTDPKRMIRFFGDLKNWHASWNDKTNLQIKYIRVYAI